MQLKKNVAFEIFELQTNMCNCIRQIAKDSFFSKWKDLEHDHSGNLGPDFNKVLIPKTSQF
jgi:hypothetical protein